MRTTSDLLDLIPKTRESTLRLSSAIGLLKGKLSAIELQELFAAFLGSHDIEYLRVYLENLSSKLEQVRRYVYDNKIEDAKKVLRGLKIAEAVSYFSGVIFIVRKYYGQLGTKDPEVKEALDIVTREAAFLTSNLDKIYHTIFES